MEDIPQRMSLAAKVRFLIMAGVGFFSDGYLNIVIGLGKSWCTRADESGC